MDKETEEALKGSIAKWKAIEEGTGKDEGTYNCSLCKLFIDDCCTDCPVREETGMSGCLGSPYEDWRETADKMTFPHIATTPHLKSLARAEREFLESLLPEEST